MLASPEREVARRGLMGRFTFVEGVAVADCAVEIEAESLQDLLETAAAALCEVMVDPAAMPETVARSLELSAADLESLLFDWLAELIFRKDRDRELFPRAEVQVEGDGPYRLRARLHGGSIADAAGALRADVKAVTFHRFSVEPAGAGWRASVVFDI